MDSEEPPNVRVACSGDIDEVVRLMHDAAAWMSAKGTPAWDVARIDRTFAETFVLRSELLVASCSDGIVGCCTLSAEDPEFWPDALKGEAAYLQALLQRLAAVRGRLSLCADQAAAAKWWLSMPMASVSAEGPMPKALSTRRTSPLMPGCRHQGRACPLRRARMTSNPLIVA